MKQFRTPGATAALLAMMCATGAAQAQTQTPPAAPAASAPVTQQGQEQGPEAMFGRWDKDHNKSISMDEFKAGWAAIQQALIVRKVHENFVTMDANKDGGIDAKEYANLELVKRAGASAPLMSAFDADKNQRLDFKEYVELIGSMMKNRR